MQIDWSRSKKHKKEDSLRLGAVALAYPSIFTPIRKSRQARSTSDARTVESQGSKLERKRKDGITVNCENKAEERTQEEERRRKRISLEFEIAESGTNPTFSPYSRSRSITVH